MNNHPMTFKDAAALTHPFYFGGPVPVPAPVAVKPMTIEVIDADGEIEWQDECDKDGVKWKEPVCVELCDWQAVFGGTLIMSRAEAIEAELFGWQWAEVEKQAKQFVCERARGR